MEKSAEAFTRQTGIQVVVEKFGYKASMAKATEDLASKDGKYDIVIQNNDALGKFASQGLIFSVDELEKASGKKADFEDDLYPNAWHGLSWYQGVRYGYPLAANTMFVLYRKDMLESPAEKQAFHARYGYDLVAPQDWKQYRDVAEFFYRPGQKFYGTLVQGKRFPAVWFEWLNFAFSFGGGVMEKEHSWEYGPIIINSPDTIQGTEYYNSLKQFSPPGVTNFTWDDAVGQMRDGHIFMCLLWSDALFHVIDPKNSTVVGKMGYSPLPSGKAGRVAQIAGSTYMVSRNSNIPARPSSSNCGCRARKPDSAGAGRRGVGAKVGLSGSESFRIALRAGRFTIPGRRAQHDRYLSRDSTDFGHHRSRRLGCDRRQKKRSGSFGLGRARAP